MNQAKPRKSARALKLIFKKYRISIQPLKYKSPSCTQTSILPTGSIEFYILSHSKVNSIISSKNHFKLSQKLAGSLARLKRYFSSILKNSKFILNSKLPFLKKRSQFNVQFHLKKYKIL